MFLNIEVLFIWISSLYLFKGKVQTVVNCVKYIVVWIFYRKLQYKPLPVEPPVQFQVVELPQAHHLCKVQSLNKDDANSEVTVYYQVMFNERYAVVSGLHLKYYP